MKGILFATAALAFVFALHFAEMALRRWARVRFEKANTAHDIWRVAHGI